MSLDIRIPYFAKGASINSQPQSHRLQEEGQEQQHRSLPRRIARRVRNRENMGFPSVSIPNPRNMHIPRPNELREKFQPEGTSGALLFGWALSSILAMIIPVSKWGAERNKYYNYYGQYNEYEQVRKGGLVEVQVPLNYCGCSITLISLSLPPLLATTPVRRAGEWKLERQRKLLQPLQLVGLQVPLSHEPLPANVRPERRRGRW